MRPAGRIRGNVTEGEQETRYPMRKFFLAALVAAALTFTAAPQKAQAQMVYYGPGYYYPGNSYYTYTYPAYSYYYWPGYRSYWRGGITAGPITGPTARTGTAAAITARVTTAAAITARIAGGAAGAADLPPGFSSWDRFATCLSARQVTNLSHEKTECSLALARRRRVRGPRLSLPA
jgi:hypothetical protein